MKKIRKIPVHEIFVTVLIELKKNPEEGFRVSVTPTHSTNYVPCSRSFILTVVASTRTIHNSAVTGLLSASVRKVACRRNSWKRHGIVKSRGDGCRGHVKRMRLCVKTPGWTGLRNVDTRVSKGRKQRRGVARSSSP